MANESDLKQESPFCKRSWKLPIVLMIVACLATFAWGFHVLGDYYDNSSYSDSSSVPDKGHMAATAVAANAGSMLISTVQPTVVSVLGMNPDPFQGQPQYGRLGSGVIVNPNGYVITTLHTISSVKDIVVGVKTMAGFRQYNAEVVKKIPDHDLALLKLVSRDIFPFITLGNSQSISLGETVYAFGDPQEINLVAQQGVIGQLGASITIGGSLYDSLMRTNAVYVWAQNGGPLVNGLGQMVGLNIAVIGSSGQVSGYVVPSHIIVAHFQDMVQFMTAGPVAQMMTPQRQNNTGNFGMGMNVAAANRAVAPPKVFTGADGWWQKAAAVIGQRQQTGVTGTDWMRALHANNAVFPFGLGAMAGSAPQQAADMSHTPGWTLLGYSFGSILGLLSLGFFAGITGGMMTMGGGIIKVTGLMLLFGYGIILVRPVAYITNIFIYGSAAFNYNRDGLIDWDNIRPLIPWAMVGVVIGYFVGASLDSAIIFYLLGAFSLMVGIKIVMELLEPSADDDDDAYVYGENVVEEKMPASKVQTGGDLNSVLDRFVNSKRIKGRQGSLDIDFARHGLLGLPMGIISGILGISGGVVEMPLQRYVAEAPLRNAIANSAALVFFASLTGSVVAMIHGVNTGAFEWETPLILAMMLIPGAYAGGMVGAWLTKVAPVRTLKWIYAVLMFAIAIRMFWS